MIKTQNSTLLDRTFVVLTHSVLFYGAYVAANGSLTVTSGLDSVWLFAGVSALFFSMLSSPWFIPPRDALATAIGAFLLYATLDLSAVVKFRSELQYMQFVFALYAVGIAATSLVALAIYEADKLSPTARALFRALQVLGKAEIVFTPAALISIVGAYQQNFGAVAWLLIGWIGILVLRPSELIISISDLLDRLRQQGSQQQFVGTVDRVDHPNIVRVKLTSAGSWRDGRLHLVSLPGGNQRYAIALFSQVQGSEVVGTGLCVGTPSEKMPVPDGVVCSAHDEMQTAEFIERLSGVSNATLIGFVVENSSISTIRFEVARASALAEGDVVFAKVEGQNVFYQILDAETNEETFDRNPRGTHIVRASQLGIYDQDGGFLRSTWLPEMNAPLFAAKTITLPPKVIGERAFAVGNVPGTAIPIVADIDEMIAYHTAVLGVTGTGKTELALDVISNALRTGAKVLCVDLTGEYKIRLGKHKPVEIGPAQEDVAALEKLIFDVDAGEFKASREKRVLREAIADLQSSAADQIQRFLEDRTSSLAIIELEEISNSRASLMIIEQYLSTVMQWAKRRPKALRILIALEEAHTIIPETAGAGFDFDTQWVVGRVGQIALQGRKYGVGLLLISQRTALVSKTVLSQCNTFLTHRMLDQTSLQFLANIYSAEHVGAIPRLADREFVAYGKAIQAERPVLVRRLFDPEKKAASDGLRRPMLSGSGGSQDKAIFGSLARLLLLRSERLQDEQDLIDEMRADDRAPSDSADEVPWEGEPEDGEEIDQQEDDPW